MSQKLNIILDLDECCIHATPIIKYQYDHFKEYKTELLKKGTLASRFKFKFDNKKDETYNILFLRPHLKKFLAYLLKNYNVSVWSNGYYTYVDRICDIIFSKAQRKQLKYIIGATDNPKWGVYDISNKKFLYDFETYKNNDLKDISFLCKTKPYSTLFKKGNTILIDNSKKHLDFNKTNVIHVKDWYHYVKYDTILLELINYFKTNSNIDTTNLKHFTKESRLKKKTKKKS